MQRPKRRKILLFIAYFTILFFISVYLFRYPLIMGFQNKRLRSLHCPAAAGNGNCLQKIWVHRVNSPERYNLLKSRYEGFEMDIAFNDSSRTFSVYHPPRREGKDTLLLENFLKHLDLQQKHFWLDTRLVTQYNMHEAIAEISRLDGIYGIRHACIIELNDVAAAALFARNGYTVGLNILEPVGRLLLSDRRIKDSLDRELAQVKYISADAQYLGPIKKLFPAKQLITWHLPFKNFFDQDELQVLLNDPKIDIILLNIKSRYQDN